MIATQGFRRYASGLRASLRCTPTRRFLQTRRRFLSSSASNAGTAGTSGGASATTSSAGMLAPFVSELDRIAPSFQIDGSKIQVIRTPAEFYETLKTKIQNAEKRIFLSTLYIGKSETELIELLRDTLTAKPELRLSILTDALRGTREAPEPSSASLLVSLVSDFGPERVEIRMYHTPNLTGLKKKHVPKRINEGWGLQHMKLYGFDDEIILSGANLSTDYFTNRQDRYHLFPSKDITNYFAELQKRVCSLSFLIKPSEGQSGFEMSWPASNQAPSPLKNPKEFVASSTKALEDIVSPACMHPVGDSSKRDTSVYVLTQMSQLLRPDSSTELPAVTHVLSTLASPAMAGSSWTFTAGYFNPAPSLTNLLLSTTSHSGTVITASPLANGFYRSRGVSGMLPDAYSLLARRFLYAAESETKKRQRLASKSSSSSSSSSNAIATPTTVTLKEWQMGVAGEPGGWTYHAKGLWVTLPGETDPSLTLVGSSNYTKRSYSLDLEANALIVTSNKALKRKLGQEQDWLQEHAKPVDKDDFAKNERRVGLKVRIAMWIVQLVGGAL